MRIHLFGVAQDEAEASLDVHSELESCWHLDCRGKASPVEAIALIRRPGGGPGDILAMACCEEHEDEVLRLWEDAKKQATGDDGDWH